MREDQIAAEAMGVDTTRYKVKAFVIGSFLAGVAGGLFAHYMMYLNPQMFMFVKSFEVVAMVVLGGLGSISGSVVAAVILTFLPEGLRSVKDYMPGGRDPRMVIYSIMLIVLMLTRPQGLLGRRELWQVLSAPQEIDAGPDKLTKRSRSGTVMANGNALLDAPDVTIRFGGLTAVSRFQPGHPAARAGRPDRSERRRQDHGLQPADRRLQTDRGGDPRRRRFHAASSSRTRSPPSAWRARSRTSASSKSCRCSTT